jgi:hypothetical protein
MTRLKILIGGRSRGNVYFINDIQSPFTNYLFMRPGTPDIQEAKGAYIVQSSAAAPQHPKSF